ncbi:MAG: response regulator [Dehalococcoidales bacterium]|jgi:DNA-binding response OmpR family regulator
MDKRPLIITVDDDQELLKMLTRLLELEGYRATGISDSRAAVDFILETKPDLIILDIVMPGLDGFQVMEMVRRHSDVPIIMLTGRGKVTYLKDALAAGADDYLVKPFHYSELVARIGAKLRRRKISAN